jgi:hypothetical protein
MDKIRVMGDEEFELYKTDRVELRKSVIAQLEASSKVEETEEKTEDEVIAEEENSEEASEEETEAVLEDEEQAVVESEDSIDPMKAVSAMLNLETHLTKDILTKYREMGKAMAENVKNNDKA